MTTLSLDAKTTALVLIDLQHGVVGMPLAPRTGNEVVENSARIAARFRELDGLVILVHVDFAEDGADRLSQPIDASMASGSRPQNWSEIVPEIQQPGDFVVTKHQWGAFYGTELDLQLRRRTIQTIVLGGIATNFGVESTARDAFERGYNLVLVEDAMAGLTEEAHKFAIHTIFPRLGRVRSTENVLAGLKTPNENIVSSEVSACPKAT